MLAMDSHTLNTISPSKGYTHTPPTTDPAIKASMPPIMPKTIGVIQISRQFFHWITMAYMAAMRWTPMTSMSVQSKVKRKIDQAS